MTKVVILWLRSIAWWIVTIAASLVIGSFGIVIFVPAPDSGRDVGLTWIPSAVMAFTTYFAINVFLQRRANGDPNAPRLRYGANIEIAQPIWKVFAFMADVRNDPRWSKQIEEVTITSPEPFGVGSTYHERVRVLGVKRLGNYTVTEYSPPSRVLVTGKIGSLAVSGGFWLEPTQRGTNVTISAETSLSILSLPFRPLQAAMAKAQSRALLSRLREILEHEYPRD